ncbi:putative ATP-dependent helicase [Cyclospora cayetanensis]|uniref:ATP-dependent helicase n=1 Tax=Cyclospora cayetanensis TaxID=88456 RepID=A0A1D3DA96_9EIME|nr:putative ATP-dependent helicase [Cyclospora cayetanensis]
MQEYEQMTRVIFNTLRGKLNAKQRVIPTSRPQHSFEWTFLMDGEMQVVEATGSGSHAAEAEIAAMQDMYIRVQEHVIEAVGSTKAGARAQAAMQMMQAAGFIEHVEDKDRQAAMAVVALVENKKDPALYVESACRLIAETRGAVWRLFLPVVWRAAMAEGNRSLVNVLIDQLKMQAAPRSAVAVAAQGEAAGGQKEPSLSFLQNSLAFAYAASAVFVIRFSPPLLTLSSACDASSRVYPTASLLVPRMPHTPFDTQVHARGWSLRGEREMEGGENGGGNEGWMEALVSVARAGRPFARQQLVPIHTGDAVLPQLSRQAFFHAEATAAERKKLRGGWSWGPAMARVLARCMYSGGKGGGKGFLGALEASRASISAAFEACLKSEGRGQFESFGLKGQHIWLRSSCVLARLMKDVSLALIVACIAWSMLFACLCSFLRPPSGFLSGAKKETSESCAAGVVVAAEEERIFLRSVQFREDDIVLLRPADTHTFTEEESWQRCFVGVVTSVKGDFSDSMNVNIRVATAEVKKYPEVFTSNKFKLYYLTPAVTHDRMVQALRGLTMSKHPAGKSPPPYVFAPEIRYLLLHTSEPVAEKVSGRGPVPQLSDTDPQQYNPLHQLDELADGDSCKKQRVQSSLLQQVAMQARRQTPSSSRSSMEDSHEMLADGFRLPTGLPLNEAQRQATISAMTNRLTLVQGPPGTGKTHVACAIIDAWQRLNPTKKILAVADSNVAADNLMEGLSNRGIRSVRVGSGSESDLKEESIQDLPRYRDLLRMRDKNSGEARSLRMLLVREAVRKYSVIIATCVGSGHEMFDDVTFERVIIDECAQSIEPSNLIPLGHGCRSVVLIGDHKQLPPTIVSREASDGGLGVSLLERFVGSGIAPIHLLNEQRRMHPSIAHFPNMQFYQGKIFSRDVDDCNRPPVAGFLWPSPHSRVCLIDISSGLANMELSLGTSKYSLVGGREAVKLFTRAPASHEQGAPSHVPTGACRRQPGGLFEGREIDPILAILRSVLQCGTIRPSEIGILTPYDAQKARIRFALNDSFDKALSYQIDVDSVDGFQGKEKDLIIFSAVRSNPRGEIGFLKDARRLNVMLTRARRGLLVVGDQLSLWRSIIPVSRLNDYLEVPTYNFNPVSTSGPRVGATAGVSVGAVATTSGATALKSAYMPQGFQADFGSGGMSARGEDGRDAAPEPMHVSVVST